MVRGCQKKIIYLKNTHSDIFDEAYFVIKDNSVYENIDECDMVEEANKILEENFSFDKGTSIFDKIKTFFKRSFVPFLIGFLLGVTIMLLI